MPATNNPNTQQPGMQPVSGQPAPVQQTTPQSAAPVPQAAPQQPVVANPQFDSQIDFMGSVIDNMLSGANKRLMIGGDTGLGKTSFVKQFAKIFGFPTVIVEIPHTVEEQLINIPFIVFDTKGQTHQGYDQVEKDDAKVVLGSSHLATTLRKLGKVGDAQYPALVKTYDSFTQELIKQFEETNPGEIAKVRSRYQRILFLDEYYRQTTPAIRNILRNVLNGRIGNDVIPPGTYVMYASNLEDVGGSMDTQSQHTTFINKKFAAPSKEQWLSYTVSSAIGKKVQFKQEVIDVFNKNLKDEHISYNDVDTGLRTSPRRWSEILLYINNAFPFKSPSEAGILLTTIKRQFQNDEKNTSALFEVLNDIIVDLCIKSKIDPKSVKAVSPTEWRKVLAQQVMTSLTVGESKKYVPVIQGLPGVGKTAIGEMFEEPPYNLRFIPILATTLTRDSVIGIPLPAQEKEKRGVKFAEPELYIMIMNMIKEAEDNYVNELSAKEQSGELNGKTADQVYSAYQQQKYKYLIFFDEINRVKDVSIFNSLRRVILEKEFNDQYKLPKEALILGAMNPTDLGTQPLTAHFRDAIELIDVEASWPDLLKFIKSQVTPYLKKLNNPSDISLETAAKIIEQFPSVFTDKKKGRASNEFYVNVGVEEVYLSPRDYDNLYRELVAGVDRTIRRIGRQMVQGKNISDDAINSSIAEAAFEKMEGTLSERFYQAQLGDPPGFFDKVRQFLNSIIDVSLTKKTKNLGLAGILSSGTPLKDNFDFDNYMSSYMPATFRKDFDEYLQSLDPETNLSELVNLASNIAEAVTTNEFDPDILDRVEDSLYDHLKYQIKTVDPTNIAVFEQAGKAYQDILDALGK
jgi:MoxR-like ATPase